MPDITARISAVLARVAASPAALVFELEEEFGFEISEPAAAAIHSAASAADVAAIIQEQRPC